MIKIPKSELYALNNDFQLFRSRIMRGRNIDQFYFVSQISHFEKRYKQAGLQKNFSQMLFSFAQQMKKLGIEDFPGILYSNLVKMPFLKPETKEFYALQALSYARDNEDFIHALARIVDLKILYKQSKNSHKYSQILFEEEKELIKICNNFKIAKSNFRTHSTEHSTIKKYKLQLAKVRVDMAKLLLRKAPSKAKVLLCKAREEFKYQGREKEVTFTELLLSEIHEYEMKVK